MGDSWLGFRVSAEALRVTARDLAIAHRPHVRDLKMEAGIQSAMNDGLLRLFLDTDVSGSLSDGFARIAWKSR